MVKELKNNSKKVESVKRSKRIQEKNKKQNQESSDSNSDLESKYSSDSEEENEMDMHEYRKFLNKIFPSKFLNKKIKCGKHLEDLVNEDIFDDYYDEDGDSDYEEEEEKEEERKHKKTSKKSPTKNEIKSKGNSNKEKGNSKEKGKSKETGKSKEKGKSKNDKSKKNNKKDKHKIKELIDAESESDSEYDTESNSDDEDDNDESEESDVKGASSKFNIIFTIGGNKDDEFDDEEYSDEYNDSEWTTENEDDPVSSDSDSEEEIEERTKNKEKDKEKKESKKQVKKNKVKQNENIDETQEREEQQSKDKDKSELDENIKLKISENQSEKTNESKEEIDLNNNQILNTLKSLQKNTNDTNNKIINECIKACEEKIKNNKKKIEKKIQKHKDKNERIFRQILLDKNTMNDFSFFKKMEVDDQIKVIKELREINAISRVEKPYRLTLLESNIPTLYKASAMKKISSLRHMEPGSGEFYKIKNWVDTFMRIPFNKTESLPVTIEDGVDKCHDFMEKSQKILDDAVYGLNDAKMQIMQMLGQLITNPKSIGTAIAIQGPMGTGKTTLVKEGISKILNRPFSFIALGGATDSSFLEGHSYTYEGSTWGKIVQILIDSKCMNPVIYFDELDKISDTPKGEEIAGILTHLTDSTQNSQFHDKYFSDIDFDLSKCLFIFSYNDENKVNPILKDRMYRIQTKGYDKKQKTVISNKHLLPKIRDQVKFNVDDIIIPDDSVDYIIENYCDREDGVRNLKRCLEIIYTKLNLYRLMKPGSNLFEQEMSLKVEFPFTVTRDIVDKLIKTNKNDNFKFRDLYI